MGLFDTLFGSTTSTNSGAATTSASTLPDIQFGRYTDSYKAAASYTAWNESIKLYNEGHYLDAYEQFMKYIRDENIDNVKYERQGDKLTFELYQGSKQVNGEATNEGVKAESRVFKVERSSVALMRRIMDLNYSFRYCRFALRDDAIVLKFDTAANDGSPEKIYYALKELATKADKHDDLMIDEFDFVKQVDNSHVQQLGESEKQTKIKWLKQWLNDKMEKIAALDAASNAGNIAYTLLNLNYKIDYLLAPEGYIMDVCEKTHNIYYAKDKRGTADKNKDMQDKLCTILVRSDNDHLKELYRTKSTFGIVQPKNQRDIANFINGELEEYQKWLPKNQDNPLYNDRLEYILSYCLFNYGMPTTTAALMHLGMKVINSDFFAELGFPRYYDATAKKFQSGAIKQEIAGIEADAKVRYPSVRINPGNLTFTNVPSFIQTLLRQIQALNYNQ